MIGVLVFFGASVWHDFGGRQEMKKKYAILYAIVICLLALAGCNGESEVIADGEGTPELLEDEDKVSVNMLVEEENKVNSNMMSDEVFIADFYYQYSGDMLIGAYQTGIDPDGYLIVSYLNYGFAYGDASNGLYTIIYRKI